ncbi:hypothetical protein Ciccas_014525, partial [Cichlidogyrus casuarinus]
PGGTFQCIENGVCPKLHYFVAAQLSDFVKSKGINIPLDDFTPNDMPTVYECKPCHPLCSQCSTSGNDLSSCLVCEKFVFRNSCVYECPKVAIVCSNGRFICPLDSTYDPTFGKSDQAASNLQRQQGGILCPACHDECSRGCHGPGPLACTHCANSFIKHTND